MLVGYQERAAQITTYLTHDLDSFQISIAIRPPGYLHAVIGALKYR